MFATEMTKRWRKLSPYLWGINLTKRDLNLKLNLQNVIPFLCLNKNTQPFTKRIPTALLVPFLFVTSFLISKW